MEKLTAQWFICQTVGRDESGSLPEFQRVRQYGLKNGVLVLGRQGAQGVSQGGTDTALSKLLLSIRG